MGYKANLVGHLLSWRSTHKAESNRAKKMQNSETQYLRRVNRKWSSSPPKGVLRTLEFFASRGLWYILSNNLESRSCRDAVQKRYRLGHVGIPLEDELKSFFAKFSPEPGTEEFAVFH